MITFGQMDLPEAERWPDLIRIVREKVKPERDWNKREVRKKYWWKFGEVAPALYAAIAPLSSCLITSGISKHRVFARVPANWIYSHNTYVFPFEAWTPFALLQSRAHVPWALRLSSGLSDRGGYRPSDCFETFPFPRPDLRAVVAALEAAGERLYKARASFMVETNQGLTKTYNALKDPACDDARILELRRLHEEMDRAVLEAYGWGDLEVPPYCPKRDAERATVKAFEDAVIDRLFALNAERAAEEQRSEAAPARKPEGSNKPRAKPGASETAKAKGKAKPGKRSQLALLEDDDG